MNKLLILAALAASAYAVDECSITWEDSEGNYLFMADVTLDASEDCYHTFFESFEITTSDTDNSDAFYYGLPGDDLATCTEETLDTDYATMYDSLDFETEYTTT